MDEEACCPRLSCASECVSSLAGSGYGGSLATKPANKIQKPRNLGERWDLGGERAYAAQQSRFFSRGSLSIICLSALEAAGEQTAGEGGESVTAGKLEEALGRPLDLLQAAAPGSLVLIVLTQCDLLLPVYQMPTFDKNGFIDNCNEGSFH